MSPSSPTPFHFPGYLACCVFLSCTPSSCGNTHISGDAAEDDDTAEAPVNCGNGVIDEGEECEIGMIVECITTCGTHSEGECSPMCLAPTGEECPPLDYEICNNSIDDDCSGSAELFSDHAPITHLNTNDIAIPTSRYIVSAMGSESGPVIALQEEISGGVDVLFYSLGRSGSITGSASADDLNIYNARSPAILALSDKIIIAIAGEDFARTLEYQYLLSMDTELAVVVDPITLSDMSTQPLAPGFIFEDGRLFLVWVERATSASDHYLSVREISSDDLSVVDERTHGLDGINNVTGTALGNLGDDVLICIETREGADTILYNVVLNEFMEMVSLEGLTAPGATGHSCTIASQDDNMVESWAEGSEIHFARFDSADILSEAWRGSIEHDRIVNGMDISMNGDMYYLLVATYASETSTNNIDVIAADAFSEELVEYRTEIGITERISTIDVAWQNQMFNLLVTSRNGTSGWYVQSNCM